MIGTTNTPSVLLGNSYVHGGSYYDWELTNLVSGISLYASGNDPEIDRSVISRRSAEGGAYAIGGPQAVGVAPVIGLASGNAGNASEIPGNIWPINDGSGRKMSGHYLELRRRPIYHWPPTLDKNGFVTGFRREVKGYVDVWVKIDKVTGEESKPSQNEVRLWLKRGRALEDHLENRDFIRDLRNSLSDVDVIGLLREKTLEFLDLARKGNTQVYATLGGWNVQRSIFGIVFEVYSHLCLSMEVVTIADKHPQTSVWYFLQGTRDATIDFRYGLGRFDPHFLDGSKDAIDSLVNRSKSIDLDLSLSQAGSIVLGALRGMNTYGGAVGEHKGNADYAYAIFKGMHGSLGKSFKYFQLGGNVIWQQLNVHGDVRNEVEWHGNSNGVLYNLMRGAFNDSALLRLRQQIIDAGLNTPAGFRPLSFKDEVYNPRYMGPIERKTWR